MQTSHVRVTTEFHEVHIVDLFLETRCCPHKPKFESAQPRIARLPIACQLPGLLTLAYGMFSVLKHTVPGVLRRSWYLADTGPRSIICPFSKECALNLTLTPSVIAETCTCMLGCAEHDNKGSSCPRASYRV